MAISNVIEINEVKLISTKEVKELLEKKQISNTALEAFKRINKLPFANVEIYYTDDIWDFSPMIKNLPIRKHEMRFKFNPNSVFLDYYKQFVLDAIIMGRSKIRTIHKQYKQIIKVIEEFAEDGFIEISEVPLCEYKDVFDRLYRNFATVTVFHWRNDVKQFINFYNTNIRKIDTEVLAFLSQRNKAEIQMARDSNKVPEVDPNYLPILINGYQTIMRDCSNDVSERVVAACALIYSQVGMRLSELATLKVDGLKKIKSEFSNMEMPYIEFLSFKTAYKDDGAFMAYAALNNIAYEALKVLLELCEKPRNNIKSDALIVFPGQRVNFFSEAVYYKNLIRMTTKNRELLKAVNAREKYGELSVIKKERFSRADYFSYSGYKKLRIEELADEDEICYPTITQFRVSVCTNMYRQRVPLTYIRRHMTHLSLEMTAYYVRTDRNVEREYSDVIYREVFENGAKLMGANADEFIDRVKKYISKNNLNIKKNIDEVVKMASERFPLRSKRGGMCIRCGEVFPCPSNDNTDALYCAYGMCPNNCHMYFMADISYTDFLSTKAAFEHNSKNGFKKAAQKEEKKLRHIVKYTLLPELIEVRREVAKQGRSEVWERHKNLREIISNYEAIYSEAEKWIS
ncbi:tyrosine-type recombinase/integrase [Butyrivibrio sp. XPD2002]|uniref:tyrosine-type recombinase/integrase n=1 Tax=Butyrivibrio sp. XPD2002 TaxID=1280665 RepID=UPI0004231CA8|nr:tyrosine-type recombinase/integrase [Butyrivibrio sp. XPD2002]